MSLIVFLIVKLLSIKLLIYGKRRLAFCLLLGFLLGYFSKLYLFFPDDNVNLSAIGNIIPGLIANWMERQGVVRTISVIIITSTIVQLLMMVLGLVTPHV